MSTAPVTMFSTAPAIAATLSKHSLKQVFQEVHFSLLHSVAKNCVAHKHQCTSFKEDNGNADADDLTDQVAVGIVRGMPDIMEAMQKAGKVVSL